MDETNQFAYAITAIGNFGFPIVITSYLLIRFEKKLEALNHTIQQLNQLICEQTERK
ncbi:YvrJ family protein [Paenibacillus sp. GCM10012303]|jgi:hypothetical protein|uniref:YvrJ family protein n=1 Tax=Paenibacillus sp. GCM10012303 TaxID=3317340 RepID=UPI0036162E0C